MFVPKDLTTFTNIHKALFFGHLKLSEVPHPALIALFRVSKDASNELIKNI